MKKPLMMKLPSVESPWVDMTLTWQSPARSSIAPPLPSQKRESLRQVTLFITWKLGKLHPSLSAMPQKLELKKHQIHSTKSNSCVCAGSCAAMLLTSFVEVKDPSSVQEMTSKRPRLGVEPNSSHPPLNANLHFRDLVSQHQKGKGLYLLPTGHIWPRTTLACTLLFLLSHYTADDTNFSWESGHFGRLQQETNGRMVKAMMLCDAMWCCDSKSTLRCVCRSYIWSNRGKSHPVIHHDISPSHERAKACGSLITCHWHIQVEPVISHQQFWRRQKLTFTTDRKNIHSFAIKLWQPSEGSFSF